MTECPPQTQTRHLWRKNRESIPAEGGPAPMGQCTEGQDPPPGPRLSFPGCRTRGWPQGSSAHFPLFQTRFWFKARQAGERQKREAGNRTPAATPWVSRPARGPGQPPQPRLGFLPLGPSWPAIRRQVAPSGWQNQSERCVPPTRSPALPGVTHSATPTQTHHRSRHRNSCPGHTRTRPDPDGHMPAAEETNQNNKPGYFPFSLL